MNESMKRQFLIKQSTSAFKELERTKKKNSYKI